MIRECSLADRDRMYLIINRAAQAYQDHIPPDCYHEPYMPMEELLAEMARMTVFGWEESCGLVGIMGYQPVRDVTLIRHAYVLPSQQGKGIGTTLLEHTVALAGASRLLVGTWAGAAWAVAFYQKRGFHLMPDKDDLLRTYWQVPERQIETSVVLGLDLPRAEVKRSTQSA